MTEAQMLFAARAVRRKRLFLALATAGVAVAGALSLYYGIRRSMDPAFSLGPRIVVVVLILLNARQNLRQHRFALILEELAPPGSLSVPRASGAPPDPRGAASR